MLRELRAFLDSYPDPRPTALPPLLMALDAALKPKRAAAPARKRRVAKTKATRNEWAAIREAVLERASDFCEACGHFTGLALQVDHFLGGSGRRRALQSVATCWGLCNLCHRDKTNNRPNAGHWLTAFSDHCKEFADLAAVRGNGGERDGYVEAQRLAEARFESLWLQGRAGGAT